MKDAREGNVTVQRYLHNLLSFQHVEKAACSEPKLEVSQRCGPRGCLACYFLRLSPSHHFSVPDAEEYHT